MSRKPMTGRNSSTVKSHNLRTILLALLRQKLVSRVDLARQTGLSSTTITNLIAELLEQGIVTEEGTEMFQRRTGAGRPRTALRLVPEARFAVGVHIGVGKIRVGLTDLRARLITSASFVHPADKSPEAVLNEMAVLIEQTITQSKVPRQNIIGVGVGASGLVNPDTGVNVMAPNLGWRDIPIRDWLATRLGLPVCVDNNVRAMALAEALFGAAQNVRVLAFVYGRIGVGAGFVVDGQLFRGSGAGAGEIGHTKVILEGGAMCRCGNRGCLEPLVSEPAIIQLAQELASRDEHSLLATYMQQNVELTIDQVFKAARAGDKAVQTMLSEQARYLGIALANLVNILNPELILLGGIFSQGQDLLLPVIEATVRQQAFANLGQNVELRPTSFGQQAGTIGGAALALTSLFYQQQVVTPPLLLPG